jgi:hypothetical protein
MEERARAKARDKAFGRDGEGSRRARNAGAVTMSRGETLTGRAANDLMRGKPQQTAATRPRKTAKRRRDALPGMKTWKKRSFALYGALCLVCKPDRKAEGKRPRKADHAHHVVPVNVILDDIRKPLELRRRLAVDARNSCPADGDCHMGHENASKRIPRSRLPLDAIAWAYEHDYGYYIERIYPE